MKGLLITILLLSSLSLAAQTERKFIREGNKLYKEQKYSDAEISYRKALDKKNNSFAGAFNTASSLYKQGKYPEAAAMFDTMAKSQTNKSNLAKIYYNQGNAYIKANKLNEGINAYKNSLKLNPKDEDTKFNLSYANRLLKKQQDKDKKDKDKDKDKNKDNKDKKDQDKKDQDKKDQDKKDNKDQQNKDQQNKDQPQKQDQKQGKDGKQQISPEAAQQILDAIQNDEKNVQQRLNDQKKQKGEKVRVEKNW
jgi:Ca-activated chloride channel homolog